MPLPLSRNYTLELVDIIITLYLNEPTVILHTTAIRYTQPLYTLSKYYRDVTCTQLELE